MHAPFRTTASGPQGLVITATHPVAESEGRYPSLRLNDRWRIIECRDGVQWILQCRHGPERPAAARWEGRSYCRTREALIRCCRAYCSEIDPAAAAALAALPPRIGEVAAPAAVVSAPAQSSSGRIAAARKVLDRELPEPRGRRPAGSGMQAAFLKAAAQRVARDPCGTIVLPTGRADAGEVAKVLHAIKSARQAPEDR